MCTFISKKGFILVDHVVQIRSLHTGAKLELTREGGGPPLALGCSKGCIDSIFEGA